MTAQDSARRVVYYTYPWVADVCMQYRTSYVQVVHTYTMPLAHGWPRVTHRLFPRSVA